MYTIQVMTIDTLNYYYLSITKDRKSYHLDRLTDPSPVDVDEIPAVLDFIKFHMMSDPHKVIMTYHKETGE